MRNPFYGMVRTSHRLFNHLNCRLNQLMKWDSVKAAGQYIDAPKYVLSQFLLIADFHSGRLVLQPHICNAFHIKQQN